MKSEMDAMGMDERQRTAWLMANRATLFIVGAVWVGMVVRELVQRRAPWFMAAMIPAFALVRFLFYLNYARTGPHRLRGSGQ